MFVSLMLCSVVLGYAGALRLQQCTSPHSPALKFSINSRRNETGHWIAQVELKHEAGTEAAGPWDVDIDHMTAKCDDTEMITIVATITAPSSSSASKRSPGPGYDLVPGFGYYKLHTDVKNWHDALKACKEEGTHLAIINSEEEAKALGIFWDMKPKILDGSPNNWAHIGFHDQYKEGDYVTIFNESLAGAGYVKWYSGEPNGVGSNCGCVYRRENLLGDILCNAKQPFFCEKEL